MSIKLTKQQQQILVGGVIGLGAFLFCYAKFFWLPISKQTAEIKGKIEALEREIEAAKRQAARLDDLEKQLVSLNEPRCSVFRRVPARASNTSRNSGFP